MIDAIPATINKPTNTVGRICPNDADRMIKMMFNMMIFLLVNNKEHPFVRLNPQATQ